MKVYKYIYLCDHNQDENVKTFPELEQAASFPFQSATNINPNYSLTVFDVSEIHINSIMLYLISFSQS